jgi:hypothetical protein
MNYYAIKVNENKEVLVKSEIQKRIKDVKVHIPVVKNKIRSGNHIAITYERSFPDYVLLECEECNTHFKKIAGMENVEELLLETIPFKEVKKFLKDDEHESYKAEILEGTYSGEIGDIVEFSGDFVIVLLKNNNKVKVPIWYIEQRVAIDDLMR